MKRDMDLVRQILLRIEECDDPDELENMTIEPYTDAQIDYHIPLLYNAGFINAHVMHYGSGTEYAVQNLTWEGHEFLDAARNENIWNSTKGAVKDLGGSVPMEVFKSLLIKTAASYFGLG